MKNGICLLLLLFLLTTLNAQLKPSTGKPYPVIDAPHKYYFAKGNSVLAVKVSRAITFQKFDAAKLGLISSKTASDLPPNAMAFENILQIGKSYYAFCSSPQQVFAREIDFDKGEFKNSWRILLTTKQPLQYTIINRTEIKSNFLFSFNFDSTKLSVAYPLSDAKKVGVHVFDSSLTPVWSGDVNVPYSSTKMEQLHTGLDKAGNVYVTAKVYGNEKPKSDSDFNNYTIELIKISIDKKVTTYPINITGKYPTNLNVFDDNKGGLLCVGFYSNGSERNGVSGILTFRFTADSKITDMKTVDIPAAVLNQYTSSKEQRKSAKDGGSLEDISLEDIILGRDGSMLLIGEQQQYFRTERVGGGGPSTLFGMRNNMLLTKLDKTGNVSWIKKVPKRQRLTSGNVDTYRYFNINGTHYFFYMDNAKNKDLKEDEVPAEHVDGQGGFLTVAKVDDSTGNTERTYLVDTRNIDGVETFQLTPRRVVHTNGTEFVFEVYRQKKQDMLVKIPL